LNGARTSRPQSAAVSAGDHSVPGRDARALRARTPALRWGYRLIFQGKHVIVCERDGWEYVERKKGKEAVAVIAATDDGKFIFVEQYRRPVDTKVLDWPAGLVGDDGENDPAATARKELEEETGYTCDEVEFLAKCPTSPGITSELVSFYRASSVKKTGDAEDAITVHLIAHDGLRAWIASHPDVLIDVKIWAGFALT